MATISTFKANLLGGGARANQFNVELVFPSFISGGAQIGQKAAFLCKSASLPSSILSDSVTWFRGRPVHLAGEREFEPWQISVYNDTDFAIRNAFEIWSNKINNVQTNEGITNPLQYQVDMAVNQLDRNGAVLKTYKFFDVWPMNVGAIELDYEQNNQVETFSVNLQYNYWTSDVAK